MIETIVQHYLRTGKLYVDNSILSTLATCETQAVMRYGYSLVPQDVSRAPLKAGSAVHKALEAHFLGDSLWVCLDILAREYESWAIANVTDGDRLSYANVREIVKSWIWHHPLEKLPYQVMIDTDGTPMVERKFAYPLLPDVDFVGAIDLVGTRTDGEGVILIDTKTTGRVDQMFLEGFHLSSQMSGYAWALEQMLGRPITSIYINVVDMRSVPDSPTRKCREHKTVYAECGYQHMNHQLAGPYYRSEQLLTRWHKNAVRLAKQWKDQLDKNGGETYYIGRVAQSGMFRYQVCNRCEFSNFCRTGRKIDQANLVSEVWSPGNTEVIINGE
jgi:hypothetical protein